MIGWNADGPDVLRDFVSRLEKRADGFNTVGCFQPDVVKVQRRHILRDIVGRVAGEGNVARHGCPRALVWVGELQQHLIIATELDGTAMHAQAEADGRGGRQFQCLRLRRGQFLHDGRRRGVVPEEQVEAVVGAGPVGDAIAAEPLGVGSKLDDHLRRAQGFGMRLDGEGQVEVLDPGRDQHMPVAIVHGIAAPDRFARIDLPILHFEYGRWLFAVGVAVEVFLIDGRCRRGRITEAQPGQ